jgi:hypothetical protein
MAVFWVVRPCSLVEIYQRFRGPCCLHHHPEDSHLQSMSGLLLHTLSTQYWAWILRSVVCSWRILKIKWSLLLCRRSLTTLIRTFITSLTSKSWIIIIIIIQLIKHMCFSFVFTLAIQRINCLFWNLSDLINCNTCCCTAQQKKLVCKSFFFTLSIVYISIKFTFRKLDLLPSSGKKEGQKAYLLGPPWLS